MLSARVKATTASHAIRRELKRCVRRMIKIAPYGSHTPAASAMVAAGVWPAKNPGENARLYQAVEAVSDFACKLGINIPTGKDSLSMVQKYPGGDVVYSPGTVIISAIAEVGDIRRTVSPDLEPLLGSKLLYIDFSKDEFIA